jgi:hypothetical protein
MGTSFITFLPWRVNGEMGPKAQNPKPKADTRNPIEVNAERG